MSHSNGNGNKPPIPFVAKSDIPIVGQPYSLKGGFCTAMMVCHCESYGEPILLLGSSPGLCPKCGRAYVIASFAFEGRTQQRQVQIAVVRVDPAPLVGAEGQVPS